MVVIPQDHILSNQVVIFFMLVALEKVEVKIQHQMLHIMQYLLVLAHLAVVHLQTSMVLVVEDLLE
jgi:hypothetical protein